MKVKFYYTSYCSFERRRCQELGSKNKRETLKKTKSGKKDSNKKEKLNYDSNNARQSRN